MANSKTTKKRRPKGDGSIQQLAKNKFKVQVTVGYDSAGRQKRKSFTGRTQKEAVAMLDKFKAERRRGDLTAAGTCRFADYVLRWLSFKKNQTKRTSYKTYSDACRLHIIPALGFYKIQKITTAHINDYVADKINSGLSSATVIQQRAIIHGILELARKEGLIGINAVDGSNPVTNKQTETKTLTTGEMKRLLAVARDIQRRKGHHFKYIFHVVLLALATGARRGEILALRWENIDFDNNRIIIKEHLLEISGGLYVDTPKTESSRRVIAVKPEVLSILRNDLWPGSGSGLVFHTRSGKPLAPSSVGKAYRRLLAEAGITGVRFHDLRHTHATRLVADGVNIKLVSRRIGHNNIRTTLGLYTHALPEQDAEAAEKMGSWLFD